MREPETGDGRFAYVGDDPTRVALLGVGIERARDQLSALSASMSTVVPRLRSAWPLGEAGDAAVHDVQLTVDFVGGASPDLDRGGLALGTYSDQLTVARRQVDDLNLAYAVLAPAELRLASLPYPPTAHSLPAWDVADSDVAVARSRAGYSTTAEIEADYAAVRRRVVGFRDECAAVLDGLAAGASRTGSVAGASSYAAGLDLLVSGGLLAYLARAGLSDLPVDASGLRAFWSTLTSAERRQLLDSQPGRFGNLDGVPVVDRDYANRLALVADLDGGRDVFARAGLAVPASPAALDAELARLTTSQWAALAAMSTVSVATVVSTFRNALAVQAQLSTGRPTRLVTYEPQAFSKDSYLEGGAAIAYGDPDTADNVALCVPGLESRVANIDNVGHDARNLYDEAARRDPGHSTAVIAWQGYDAPELPWALHPNLGIVGEGRAESGAVLLAAAVRGLRATHEGTFGLTVIGHSYGSTTTGLALQHHAMAADVDRVVLVGSPGVGGDASTVSGLGLRGDQLFVGTASHDVIGLTANTTLGKNPLDPDFGGTRFEAESLDRGDSPWGVNDHSRYFSTEHGGSESLASLGEIVTGHADRLGVDGLVAGKPTLDRLPFRPGDPLSGIRPEVYDDPERHRMPTGGHF